MLALFVMFFGGFCCGALALAAVIEWQHQEIGGFFFRRD